MTAIKPKENVNDEFLESIWQEKMNANPLTLKKTLVLIWSDARQKRFMLLRPFRWYNVFIGIFSVNGLALALWRISIWLTQKRWMGWRILAKIIYFLNIMLFSFDASPFSTIGPGLVVAHLVGCTIHAKIGANCHLYGRNALGGLGYRSAKGWFGGPVLEDGVTIGFGASVLGPVTIGVDATIGAGAWCFKDIPAQTIAIGMPAAIHRKKTDDELRALHDVREGKQCFRS